MARDYMIGMQKKTREVVFGSSDVNKVKEGHTSKKFWTGYNVKKGDTLWLRELQGTGNIFAKAKVLKHLEERDNLIKGKKSIVNYFEINIIEIVKISTEDMFKRHSITSNANHGVVNA